MLAKNRMRFFAFGLVLALAALFVSGCAKKNEVNADLTSYKITLDKATASSGKITFHIKNSATDMKHEFVVFKTDLDASQLPLDADGNVVEDQLQKVDEKELEANTTADLVIDNISPGHYAIICNQPGHYKQGMYVNFTVQ